MRQRNIQTVQFVKPLADQSRHPSNILLFVADNKREIKWKSEKNFVKNILSEAEIYSRRHEKQYSISDKISSCWHYFGMSRFSRGGCLKDLLICKNMKFIWIKLSSLTHSSPVKQTVFGCHPRAPRNSLVIFEVCTPLPTCVFNKVEKV